MENARDPGLKVSPVSERNLVVPLPEAQLVAETCEGVRKVRVVATALNHGQRLFYGQLAKGRIAV